MTLVKQVEGTHGRAVYFFGVGQNPLLGLEAFVFSRFQLGLFNLALLESPQIEEAEPVLLAVLEFFDSTGNTPPAGECLAGCIEMAASLNIKQSQAGGGIERKQGFVLRMDDRQAGRELAQHAHGGWLIIYEDAALAADRDLAPQNHGFILGINAVALKDLADDLFRAAFNFKNR